MKVFAFPNANCSTISVTSSAQTLESLINTAGSVTVNYPNGVTAVDLIIENGDIRVLYDGNIPSASKGLLFKQGSIQRIRGVAIENIQLISVSGSAVAVDVTIGKPGAFDEASSGAGAGGTSGASTTDESAFTAGSTAGTLAMGVYESSADTLTSGQAAAVAVDVNRNLKVTQATLEAGEDLTNNVTKVEQRFSYQNITLAAPTTTTVKSGAGFLHAITINKPVASSVITIYDNTAGSGTVIGTITLPATLLAQGPYTAIYDVAFGTGLTIVTATGASDITVSFR